MGEQLETWPTSDEDELYGNGLETLAQTRIGKQAVRLVAFSRDKAPREPVYAELLDVETGEVRRLSQLATKKHVGTDAHLFSETDGEATTYHVAIIDHESTEGDGITCMEVAPELMGKALNTPLTYLQDLEQNQIADNRLAA